MTRAQPASSAGAILSGVVRRQRQGAPQALYAACTASPFAIRAVLRQARRDRSPALIESTASQVNLQGGYAGATPQRFQQMALRLAAETGLAPDRVLVGGDHIGPHLWRQADARLALGRASELAAACVAAGYRKLHLDTAVPCRDDPREADGTLPLDLVSRRAAILCRAAETAAGRSGWAPPWYVVGSDVPPPGGGLTATDALPSSEVGKVRDTVAAHRQAFLAAGLAEAWERVFAVVVFTGADFSPRAVHPYDTRRMQPLAAWMRGQKGLVFEAHSTDFQTPEALFRMVADHVGILKVGPALTYAMREALFALADLEGAYLADARGMRLSRLPAVMDALMLADRGHWQAYYRGTAAEQAALRRNAYSDRIRYYWSHPRAAAAVERLMRNLRHRPPPQSLIDRYLPDLAVPIRGGDWAWDPHRIVVERIGKVAQTYARACRLSPT